MLLRQDYIIKRPSLCRVFDSVPYILGNKIQEGTCVPSNLLGSEFLTHQKMYKKLMGQDWVNLSCIKIKFKQNRMLLV